MNLIKKYFFNIYLIAININKYGIKNIIAIICYEFLFFFKGYKDLFYEDSLSTKYTNIIKYKSKSFDGVYSPTPFYFLSLIKKKLKIKKTLKNKIFIDFGCGTGRVLNFFYNDFKKLIGIDHNKNYHKFFKCKKKIFFNINLRNINKIKKKKILFKNEAYLFFYQPFDEKLILKLIKLFKKKLIIITINTNVIKFKNCTIIYKKIFKSNNKNIYIYKNY